MKELNQSYEAQLRATGLASLATLALFLLVLLHYRSGCNLFRSLSVPPRFLGLLFNVFVLALFLAAGAPEVLSLGHGLTS
jgi:hypothetical protein